MEVVWQRCSVADVEPRKPVEIDPTDDITDGLTVDDVERLLTAVFGGHWVGFHRGVAGADAGVWVQLDEVRGSMRTTGVLLLGDAVNVRDLAKVKLVAIENSVSLGVAQAEEVAREELAKLPPLTRDPDTSPEEWSARVAAHFRIWARAVPNPGAAIAAEWGVNRQTVGSWIREARLRGLLPPARAKKPAAKRSTMAKAKRRELTALVRPDELMRALEAHGWRVARQGPSLTASRDGRVVSIEVPEDDSLIGLQTVDVVVQQIEES